MNTSRPTTNRLILIVGISTCAICLSCTSQHTVGTVATQNASHHVHARIVVNHASGEGADLDKVLKLFGKSVCKVDSADRENHITQGQPTRARMVGELKSDLADMRLHKSLVNTDELGLIPSYIAVEQATVEPRALIANVQPIVDKYRD